MSVEIKYKGNTIASASTDTTKTIKTSGKYCEADIEVINTPDGGDAPVINPLSVTANGTYTEPSGIDGYSPVTVNVPQGITPTGNINITDTNVTDVTNYATAQVVDADLIASNIKKDVNILGVVGSFEGGGGLPSTWEYTTGEFTLASDITSSYRITHNLGVIPDIIYVAAVADVDDVPSQTIMMACRFFSGKGLPFKDSLAVTLGLQQKSAYFQSENNSENHYVGYKGSSAYNLEFNDIVAFIGAAANSTTFLFYGTSDRVMRTGIKYVWYAIKVN